VDGVGIGLLAVGIGTLQFLLDKGQTEDWFDSNLIRALAVASASALILFVIHALVAKDPVLDLRVLKDRTYSAGVFMMTVLGFVLFGSLVMLPLFLQTVLGYPALQAGIAMAPRGIGSFLAMPLVGILMSKLDPRKMLATGLVIAGVTLYMLSDINLSAGYWDIFWPQLLQGSAMGLLFIPLSTMSMASIPREKMGNATSLFNLMRNLGGGLGIAFVATSVSRSTTVHSAVLAERLNPYSLQSQAAVNGARSLFMSRGSDWNTATSQAYGVLNGMIHQQAAMLAFIDIVRLLAAIFILIIPLVLIMRRPRGTASPPPGAH
jgi:DHA2 family multidrug resistance protein